jgi:hypothetical protein
MNSRLDWDVIAVCPKRKVPRIPRILRENSLPFGRGASMLIRPPRWLLVAEALVVLCAVVVLAYKAAMWVRPLGRVDQAQFLPKVDPKTRINDYVVPENIRNHGRENHDLPG